MGRDHDDTDHDDDEEVSAADLTRMVITVSIGVGVAVVVLLALAYFHDKKLPAPVLDIGAPTEGEPAANGTAPGVSADEGVHVE